MAHNTLVVDGTSSSRPGRTFNWTSRADAAAEKWIAQDRSTIFAARTTDTNGSSTGSLIVARSYFLKGDYWIVIDTAKALDRHDYALNFRIAEGRDTRELDANTIGGSDHRIFTFGDDGHWEQMGRRGFNRSLCRTRALRFSALRRLATARRNFLHLLCRSTVTSSPTVEETPMAGGRAFLIKYAGYTDIFLTQEALGRDIDNGIFECDFRHAWARLRDDEQLPDELVLIDGRQLNFSGSPAIDSEPSRFATGRRFGSEFYITTDSGHRVVKFHS